MPDRPPLSLADLIASAVSTEPRTAAAPCPTGTHERMLTLAAAAEEDLQDHPLHDVLCDKVTTLGAFILHCAWVEHTLRSVVPLPYIVQQHDDHDDLDEARLRDLGRGGESKTAAAR